MKEELQPNNLRERNLKEGLDLKESKKSMRKKEEKELGN